MLEYATALKVGTTSIMLSLIEEGAGPPDLMLQDAVLDLKQISRDPGHEWIVTLDNGKKISAVEMQHSFLNAAKKYLSGKDSDADWVITEWAKTLEALAKDPYTLVGKIDWISKKWLLEMFLESEGKGWEDPWAVSLDLEYHNLNPGRGLSFALEEEGKVVRKTIDSAIELATHCPPRNTRASARGDLAKSILALKEGSNAGRKEIRYIINWTDVQIEGKRPFMIEDPFNTYTGAVQKILG